MRSLQMSLSRALTGLAVCVCCAAAAAAPATHLKTLTGFAQPECVLVDPETGTAYVSNINAKAELYWQDTGAGFLFRFNSDGTMETLKWVASTPDFVIHQPKGMALLDGVLYVADNTRVLSFSLPDGDSKKIYPVEGAQRLNDMASGTGNVYVTDVATGKIHRIDTSDAGKHDVVAAIDGVNGITLRDGIMYAVTWTLHDVFEVALDGSRPPVAFGLAAHFTHLDGVEPWEDGGLLISDPGGNKIGVVAGDRRTVDTFYEMPEPADIGIDRERQRVYAPQLTAGAVVVLSFSPQGEVLPLASIRDREFDELQRQILDRPRWDNARLAREAHRPEALILETDQNPVDIVWRRTRALLDHVAAMPPVDGASRPGGTCAAGGTGSG